MVVINPLWYTHGCVAGALGGSLVAGRLVLHLQVLFAVFLDVVVHEVGSLPQFGAVGGVLLVIRFAYLVVVVTRGHVLVVETVLLLLVHLLELTSARSVWRLVVRRVHGVHYGLIRLGLQAFSESSFLLGLIGYTNHLILEVWLGRVVVCLLALIVGIVYRASRLLNELRVSPKLLLLIGHVRILLVPVLLVHIALGAG